MGDFKIDLVVRESKKRHAIDKYNDIKPEEAIFILDSKYNSFNNLKLSKGFKQNLVVNVDEFIKIYKKFFDLRKNKR